MSNQNEKIKFLDVNHQGFTFIELMIAMLILVIVIAGTIRAYKSQQNAQLAQKQVIEMQQNLRAALYIMAKDIRMAGYDPSLKAKAGITQTGNGSVGSPFEFTFLADEDGMDNDGDGTTDEANELRTVSFVLFDSLADGDTDLGRKVDSGFNQAIAENISALQFTYLDANGAVTAVTGNIRAIGITITAGVDVNEFNLLGVNRTISTIIKCRNL